MASAALKPTADLRRQWLKTISALMRDVSDWAESAGWLVHRSERPMKESLLGEYAAPVLQIKTPADHIVIEPVAMGVSGADGRIDMTAWPTLRRVAIYRKKGRWAVRTDSVVA